MTRAMYDSVTAARLPADATLVGAYTDGHYANEAAVRARCPHATVVRITPHGLAGAHVADCETGDLTPVQAASWAANEIRAGRKPTIYCNLSTWPAVKAEVAKLGISAQVSWWVAHYTGQADMIPGAVAHQYVERTDLNLDFSVAADYWPGVDPEPHNAVRTPAQQEAPVTPDDHKAIAAEVVKELTPVLDRLAQFLDGKENSLFNVGTVGVPAPKQGGA